MTDVLDISLPKIGSSITLNNKENSIVDNDSKTTDKEARKSGYESEIELNECENSLTESPPTDDEWYRTVQAVLFIISVLGLSYHGFHYGRTEYNLLENGRSPNGFLVSHKKVVTLILGYSLPYSIISSITALMLSFSLATKRPHWSLPSIIIFMSDLVCDVGDALMATWLFFNHLPTSTAIFYTACTLFVVLGEFWCWLGVLRLYESRVFK